jgi:dipeptidyl aminopeptidase/acylaminoacyl peptidase
VPGLGPVALAHIAANPISVRPGPGPDFAPIGELTQADEKLTLLAVDPTHQWVAIVPEFQTSSAGWVAVTDLQLTEGDLAAAPEIYTGWSTSNDLALRTGPGIYTDEVGRLAINNLVRVVGVNDSRSWVLVQPLSGSGEGWAQVRFFTFSQPLVDLPLAPAAPAPAPTPVPIDPALSTASAKQGTVVFQTSSGGDIMVINADGSGLRRLTYGLDPALSPDGQTVAFTRWDQGEGATGSVWLIGLDGRNERQLLGFIKQPKGPEWSPDGSQVVINYQHEGRTEEKETRILYTPGRVSKIPWNAGKPKVEVVDDKPYLVYTLPPDPHWGLRVINVVTGAFEDKDGGTYAFRPAWDPQQSWRLVSDGGQGLVEVDVNRNFNQAITQNGNDGSPVFSPDGRFIALTAGKPGGGDGFDIYRLNRDGSGRVQLTQTPLYEAVMPEAQGKQWSHVSPAWSPDGSQIAFLTNRTGRWEVWVMNFDGSNQRPMFTAEVNNLLDIQYNFVDERAFSWR